MEDKQKTAEAVAGFVDSEQLDELKRGECVAIQLGTYSRRYRRTLPVYTSPPPAIDIGKLRELVGQLKAMSAGERERAKHYSVPTRDAQAMHGLARILDEIVSKLAALIGDSEE